MLIDFRVRQRDYLLEIARAISQELELDKLLERILSISAEMLAGQAGFIALRAEEGGWKVAASYGIPNGLLRHLSPLLAEVPDHEDPARFELPEINRLLRKVTRNANLGWLNGIGLPLNAGQRVIGVIFVFRSYAGVFSRNDLNLLQSFADQAAIAVQNAQLYTQIRQEKQRMSALLDSVADGILILSPDLAIEHSNPAFVQMYGIPRKRILGRNHRDVIRWAEVDQGMPLEQAQQDGWPQVPSATLYVEGDLIRPGGLPLPVGITYAPLLSVDKRLLNVIASVRDISHFREADDLKSTFISVISHELRTPVALIKGYVSTLRREDAVWDPEVVQDSLEVIEEESDRLTALIDNLLDASRLEAGALSLNRADLALDHLVERVVERFRTQTSRHDLQMDFPPDFPVILGDETRLTQVLSNLISNAIKYSPEGGTIRVSGQVHPEHVLICVTDEGQGIAPRDVPHVFDRFYRATETARTTKGAGLGLYLSRAVVEAHDGRIWVDSAVEEGARICFSLPRPAESDQRSPAS